jgi:hypothetical protein
MLSGHPILFKSLCYVDGAWRHSDSATTIAVLNPADQSVIGHVPMLERAQIVAAIDAAQRAFESWRWVPQEQRSAALLRWHALILRHRDDLAALLSQEQGKPLSESQGEIRYAASFVEWFAYEAKRLTGRTIPTHIDGAHLGTVMEPVGRCRARRRLHGGGETGARNAVLGAGARAARGGGRLSRRRFQRRARRTADGDGNARERHAGARRELHRLDARGCARHPGRGARGHQESRAGAGRQRAVHRRGRCSSSP